MKRIIHRVQAFFERYSLSNQKLYERFSSAKTHTRTYDTLRASPSQSQRILKQRISRRLSEHYSKSTPLILATQYQATVILSSGVKKEFCCGTYSQAVHRVSRYLMIGTSTVTLQKKSSPNYPRRAGSFLLFSERWPDVISTKSISQKTLPWLHRIRHPGFPRILEHHSSGRVYLRLLMTT